MYKANQQWYTHLSSLYLATWDFSNVYDMYIRDSIFAFLTFLSLIFIREIRVKLVVLNTLKTAERPVKYRNIEPFMSEILNEYIYI